MGPAASDCRCRTRWRSNQPGLSSAAKVARWFHAPGVPGYPPYIGRPSSSYYGFHGPAPIWRQVDSIIRDRRHIQRRRIRPAWRNPHLRRYTTRTDARDFPTMDLEKKFLTGFLDDLNANRVTLP